MIGAKELVHRTINVRIKLAPGRKSGFNLIYISLVSLFTKDAV